MGQQKEPLLAGKIDEGHLLRFLRGVEAGSSLGLLPGRITPEGRLGWEGAAGVGAGIALDPLTKLLGAAKLGTAGARAAIAGAEEAPKAMAAIHLLAPEVVGTAGRAASRVPEALNVAIPEGMKGIELANYLRRARRVQQLKDAGAEAFSFLHELTMGGLPAPESSVSTAAIRNLLGVGNVVAKNEMESRLNVEAAKQREFEKQRAFDQQRVRDEQRLARARRGTP